jgi:hypothetical protein
VLLDKVAVGEHKPGQGGARVGEVTTQPTDQLVGAARQQPLHIVADGEQADAAQRGAIAAGRRQRGLGRGLLAVRTPEVADECGGADQVHAFAADRGR